MFFDTNVLIRARFEAAPGHELARRRMSKAAEGHEALRISRQVLREYLAVVTRPQAWSPPVPMDEALEHAMRLEAEFDMLEDGPAVTDALAALCREVPVAGKQVHDANIVATMLAHGERRLLTFDARGFQRYEGRIELVPAEMAG